jgi:hypothetical protein
MIDVLCGKFINKHTDLEKMASQFSGMKMQIGFFEPTLFFKFDHKNLIEIFEKADIAIESIHAPTIDVFEEKLFYDMLVIIRDIYKTGNITIHPKPGNYFSGMKLLKKYNEVWDDYLVALMYENFDSSKKNRGWLPNAKMIASLPFPNPVTGLTYDTSHVNIGTNIVDDFSNFYNKLYMIHLSNKKKGQNHLPIFEGDHDLKPVLQWLKKKYRMYVVLEYHDNDTKLIEDYHRLSKYFRNPDITIEDILATS